MSSHEPSDEQLWAYLDGELPAAEQGRLAAHITTCVACQARLQVMRERPLPPGPLPMLPAPPDLQRRVMARIAVETGYELALAGARWLAPLASRTRLRLASALALALALVSAAIVSAALAVSVVEAATPAPAPSIANSMLLAVAQALEPMRPFFARWGWCVLALGMLATLLVPSVRAVALRYERMR